VLNAKQKGREILGVGPEDFVVVQRARAPYRRRQTRVMEVVNDPTRNRAVGIELSAEWSIQGFGTGLPFFNLDSGCPEPKKTGQGPESP
jgi:hypothetical protein